MGNLSNHKEYQGRKALKLGSDLGWQIFTIGTSLFNNGFMMNNILHLPFLETPFLLQKYYIINKIIFEFTSSCCFVKNTT